MDGLRASLGRIEQVRTTQPQSHVGIDWGNPLARGLVGVTYGTNSMMYNPIAKTYASCDYAADASSKVAKLGEYAYKHQTSDVLLDFMGQSISTSSAVSAILTIRFLPVSRNLARPLVSLGYFGLAINIAADNTIQGAMGTYYGGPASISSSKVITFDQWNMVSLVRNYGGTIEVWLNGEKLNSIADGGSGLEWGEYLLFLRIAPYIYGVAWEDYYSFACVHLAKVPSSSLIPSLHSNPWQIFEPKKYFLPVTSQQNSVEAIIPEVAKPVELVKPTSIGFNRLTKVPDAVMSSQPATDNAELIPLFKYAGYWSRTGNIVGIVGFNHKVSPPRRATPLGFTFADTYANGNNNVSMPSSIDTGNYAATGAIRSLISYTNIPYPNAVRNDFYLVRNAVNGNGVSLVLVYAVGSTTLKVNCTAGYGVTLSLSKVYTSAQPISLIHVKISGTSVRLLVNGEEVASGTNSTPVIDNNQTSFGTGDMWTTNPQYYYGAIAYASLPDSYGLDNPWKIFKSEPKYVPTSNLVQSSQPKTVDYDIDWSNPITVGLKSLVNPVTQSDLLDPSLKFARDSVVTINEDINGTSYAGVGSSLSGVYAPSNIYGNAGLTTPVFSLFALTDGKTKTNGSWNKTFGVGDGLNGGFAIGSDYYWPHAIVKTDTGVHQLDGWSTTTNWKGNSLIGLTCDGTNMRIWDGNSNILSRTITGTTMVYDNTYGHYSLFGSSGDTVKSSGGSVYYGAIWNRPLTATEISSLSANPWQIFKAKAPSISQKAPTSARSAKMLGSRGGLGKSGVAPVWVNHVKMNKPYCSNLLNFNNPITKGLVVGLDHTGTSFGTIDVNRTVVKGVGYSIRPTPNGEAIDASKASPGFSFQIPFSNLPEFTLVTVGYIFARQSPTNENLSAHSVTSSGGTGQYVSDYDAGVHLRSCVYYYPEFNGSSLIYNVGCIPASGKIVAATTFAKSDYHTLYVNGTQVVTGATAAFNANFTYSYNGWAVNTLPQGINVQMTLIFNRKLNVNEIKSISDNPWQIFQSQQSNIWTPT